MTKDLGPCQVLFNSIDLGPTLGGVTAKEEQHTVDIKEDGHGDTPVDAITTGKITAIEANFTRSSLTQLEQMIKAATKTAKNSVGEALYSSAAELILKPLVNNVASVTPSEWLHFYKAVPLGAPEWKYDNNTQRVLKVNFKVFPDQTSGNVGEIWRMGPAS
jgi:hypothetical protein